MIFFLQEVRCRNNGSCTYEGKTYDNWSRLPTNVTGCEKECFCEFGNVTCSAACPPVTPQPPPTLNCKGQAAMLTHLSGDDCCMHWVCAQTENNVPGINNFTFYSTFFFFLFTYISCAISFYKAKTMKV